MTIRSAVPAELRVAGRRAAVQVGRASAGWRPLPDFLVIGGQRCGTTSLFRALMDHPQVRRPNLHKGVNYFDVNYSRGQRWYRGHFPVRGPGSQTRVFDASGYYMVHPLAAARIARDLPQVKVIALVRDPVERAWSAYKHELARGFEWERSFLDALRLEDERLDGEVDRMLRDPDHQSFNHRHHAYRRRGEYADLLAPFVAGLSAERVLVVESERFFARPAEQYERVTSFLGVRPHQPARFDRWNARPGSEMPDPARDLLRRHFAEHDERLGALLGRPPAWRVTA
ncbi:sulfotransferase family protein [Nocardioides pantholopis]|uniref:sulfotransferase family protein n=1 Tax=Nocardioides pantholopis TaxID=2483798 RepID=UPI000F089C15|nr:sulfotransferase [Nocardioides pantholopis]